MLHDTVTRDEHRAARVAAELGLVREEHRPDLYSHHEAVFSADGRYRYLLIRRWHPGGTTCTFALLNPSMATAFVTDPTATRCEGYARREGCNALAIVNANAFRATNPMDLRCAEDPVGEHNDRFIELACLPGRLVIAGWGAHGDYQDRGRIVASALTARGVDLQCFGTTASGQPVHPLYQRADAALRPYLVSG